MAFDVVSRQIDFSEPNILPVGDEALIVTLDPSMPPINLMFSTRPIRRRRCSLEDDIRVAEQKATANETCKCIAFCIGDVVTCSVSESGTYAPAKVLCSASDTPAVHDGFVWNVAGVSIGVFGLVGVGFGGLCMCLCAFGVGASLFRCVIA